MTDVPAELVAMLDEACGDHYSRQSVLSALSDILAAHRKKVVIETATTLAMTATAEALDKLATVAVHGARWGKFRFYHSACDGFGEIISEPLNLRDAVNNAIAHVDNCPRTAK